MLVVVVGGGTVVVGAGMVVVVAVAIGIVSVVTGFVVEVLGSAVVVATVDVDELGEPATVPETVVVVTVTVTVSCDDPVGEHGRGNAGERERAKGTQEEDAPEHGKSP